MHLILSTGALTLALVQSNLPVELEFAGAWYPLAGAFKAVVSPTKSSGFHFDAHAKCVTIKRLERVTEQDPWSFQRQVLSVTYEPVDVRCTKSKSGEIKKLYVCGVDGPGSAIIEKWGFRYPAVPPSGFVPLEQRPAPFVQRTIIFQGPSIGIIANIDVDPEERFLHLFTYPNRFLHRLKLGQSTFQPPIILSPANFAPLDGVRSLKIVEHITEGRQIHMCVDYLWDHDRDLEADMVILHDSNNDGEFDSPEVITGAEWQTRNYSGLVWNDFYR